MLTLHFVELVWKTLLNSATVKKLFRIDFVVWLLCPRWNLKHIIILTVNCWWCLCIPSIRLSPFPHPSVALSTFFLRSSWTSSPRGNEWRTAYILLDRTLALPTLLTGPVTRLFHEYYRHLRFSHTSYYYSIFHLGSSTIHSSWCSQANVKVGELEPRHWLAILSC